MKQYGGALFNDTCKCGRQLKMPEKLDVNKFMAQKKPTLPAICQQCGKVEAEFVRFEKGQEDEARTNGRDTG